MQYYDVEVDDCGAIFFYKKGTRELHRLDGPAAIWASGTRFYYQNDKIHRLDGPAVEGSYGTKKWCIEGEELTEEEFIARTAPAQEFTVAELEALLGKKIKIVKG